MFTTPLDINNELVIAGKEGEVKIVGRSRPPLQKSAPLTSPKKPAGPQSMISKRLQTQRTTVDSNYQISRAERKSILSLMSVLCTVYTLTVSVITFISAFDNTYI